jgi:hypothetical protein
MTPKQPPKFATWMLKHFGSGPNNDSVLGDLAEQYLHNGSALWYWRQAMKAIPVSFFREIRAHKALALNALVTGWVIWFVGAMSIFPVAFYGTNLGVDIELRYPVGSAWSLLWAPILGPPVSQGPIYVGLAIGLPLIVGIICGWLVVHFRISAGRHPLQIRIERIHRDRQTGVVLLFAGSMLLLNLLLFGPFIEQVGSDIVYRFIGPLVASCIASIMGILLGGGLLRTISNP